VVIVTVSGSLRAIQHWLVKLLNSRWISETAHWMLYSSSSMRMIATRDETDARQPTTEQAHSVLQMSVSTPHAFMRCAELLMLKTGTGLGLQFEEQVRRAGV